MLHLPIQSAQPEDSIYAKLGLNDLPFPTLAVSDPYNTDPRRNGAIYAENPVRSKLKPRWDVHLSGDDDQPGCAD